METWKEPTGVRCVRSGIAAMLFAVLGAPSVLAQPVTLEETARIPAPDPAFAFPLSVAVDGDWVIATGSREIQQDGTYATEYGAWAFRRQPNGSWQLAGRLLEVTGPEEIFGRRDAFVDMDAGVAAVLTSSAGTWVFERSGERWTTATHAIDTNNFDVAVSNGTIVVSAGHCEWLANAYRKGPDNVWRLVRRTDPETEPPIDCEGEYQLDNLDASRTSIILSSTNATGPAVRIFDDALGSQGSMTRLSGPDGTPANPPLAIDADTAVANSNRGILHTYSRSGAWQLGAPLLQPEFLNWSSAERVEIRGPLVVMGRPDDPARGRFAGSLAVFERNASGSFRYAAKLHASDQQEGTLLGLAAQISGRRVVAGSVRAAAIYVYDLPATLNPPPQTQQYSLESGSWADWMPLAGSQFAVATSGATKVLRQTSTTGNAAAILDTANWTNQSIEADIKPTAYASGAGSRWFGLVTRYTDGQNYYYVTLRNSNEIHLRKMVDGAFTSISSTAMPINLNRTYRVRLEAIGTRLRVIVGDEVVLEATDTTHSRGRAGVFMYKTAADYDNVVVTPNARTVLVNYSFYDDVDSYQNWELLGDWEWTRDPPPGGNGIYRQNSVAGNARAIAGVDTGDQVVRSRIKRTSAAGTNNWFGLAARYRDAGNYYYVTLRNNNTAALRKLVNGAIVELDSAPLSLADATWYDVRLSAIGEQLRLYVNGALLLEAHDSSHLEGRYGAITYKTAATYDDFLAVQP